MLEKVAVGLLVLAILGYVAGIATADAFVYILCFVILVAAALFGLLVLAMNIIWKLIPADSKKTGKWERGRFNMTIFYSILVFFIVNGVINKKYLPDASGLISLLGSTMTFIFAVFFGWSLIRRSKVRTIAAGSVVFILFIALLSFVSPAAIKSGEVAQVSSIEKLKSLGYVAWVSAERDSDIEKTGVIQYDPASAFDGINIYFSKISREAYLIDMHGNVVHKWANKIEGANPYRDVELCRNGDLLVSVKDQMLLRLDWDSNIKWKKKMRAHHDVSVDENRKIYAIARDDELAFWHGIPVPILGDYIAVLLPGGELEKKIYLYDLVKEHVPLDKIIKIYRTILRPRNLLRIFNRKAAENYVLPNDTDFDIMHANTIEVMDRDVEGFCKKGDWLISIRELDLVAVLDATKEELVWSWGPGELNKQHHPTLLKNENVLIFDNGPDRGFSRVVELNPLTKKIVWEYKSDPPEEFLSVKSGACQRLPNGNTLITESYKGRIFEITKEGKIVWDFYNPEVNPQVKKRGTIYRMMRITNPKIYELIRM